MSNPKNPPAFPRDGGQYGGYNGMDLRDWFAGQALIGWRNEGYAFISESVARECYSIADAMLAERAKGGEA